ncbi:MAG TPA: hypothetical protein VF893_06135 [Candidatus Bathyarchaeia archaeon]
MVLLQSGSTLCSKIERFVKRIRLRIRRFRQVWSRNVYKNALIKETAACFWAYGMINAKALIVALSFFLVLSSWLVMPTPNTFILPAMAQTSVQTSAFIYLEPNRVAAGQTVAITMLIEPPPPETAACYGGLQISITHPDGKAETLGPFFTNAQGSANTIYASSYTGTYSLQLTYPGETFANGTITYQGSASIAIGLSVNSPYDIPSISPNPTPTPGAALNENTWAKKASMHEPRGGLGVAVVNNRIYAIGGSSASGLYPANILGGFVGTNEEYDPATDSWTYRSPMPTSRSDFAIAVYNHKIYCMGGTVVTEKVDVIFSKFVTSEVNEVYDPVTDSWETKAPLPNAGMFMQAFVDNNKIHVIDGRFHEIYDPATDSWTTNAPTPLPAEDYGPSGSNDYAIFRLNNKLYVAGQYSNRFITYDLTENTWSNGSELPAYDFYSLAGSMTTGTMAPKRFYLLFGIRGWVPSAVTQAYDPVNNVWLIGKPIPTNRIHPGIAIVDDKIYVIGGYAMSISGRVNASALNEQYTPIGYGLSESIAAPAASSTSSPTSSTTQPADSAKTANEEPTEPSSPPPQEGAHTQEPEPEINPEPFPVLLVAFAIAAVAASGTIGLFFYHRKRCQEVVRT